MTTLKERLNEAMHDAYWAAGPWVAIVAGFVGAALIMTGFSIAYLFYLGGLN